MWELKDHFYRDRQALRLREGLRRLRNPQPDDKRRRVDVARAKHLYGIWRHWSIVAELMPGGFQPDSIRSAVSRSQARQGGAGHGWAR
jgi:hypothetical protein